MPVKMLTESAEKEVDLMVDPTAEFVSLVKHGANRMPFRVIKAQKGGTVNPMPMVVQSILLPNGLKLEEASALQGNEWLAEAVVDKRQEFEGYTKLVQAEASKFDGPSMRLLKLPGGAMALMGKLTEGEDSKGMLTVSEEVFKENGIVETTLDATVATVTTEPEPWSYDLSFRDLLYREMDSLNAVIFGTLQQAASDPKKRKSTIMGAVEAFKSFMNMALDAVGGQAMKMEIPKLLATEKVDDDNEDQPGGTEMFKTKEEFAAAVGAVVDEKLTAFKEEMAPKADPTDDVLRAAKDEQAKSPVSQAPDIAEMISKAVTAAMVPLADEVKAIAAKQDVLGEQLGITPASGSDDTPVKKAEGDKDMPAPDPASDEAVFSGLFTGQTLSRGSMRQAFFGE